MVDKSEQNNTSSRCNTSYSENKAINLQVCVLAAQSCPTLCDPWTVPCQAPLSMEFSRQEH